MKLTPTRRTDYGIRALVFLAGRESKVKAKDIGAAMSVPTGFLHEVLQQLQRARLVTSQPGPSGGYALARPAATITIREIVESLEGPIALGQCALRGGPCHWDEVCALHWVWSAAVDALGRQLDEATLGDVAADDRELAAGTKAIPADAHRLGRARGAGGTKTTPRARQTRTGH